MPRRRRCAPARTRRRCPAVRRTRGTALQIVRDVIELRDRQHVAPRPASRRRRARARRRRRCLRGSCARSREIHRSWWSPCRRLAAHVPRLAAVLALGEQHGDREEVVGVVRVDDEARVVERPLVDERVRRGQFPGRAAVVGAPQQACLSTRRSRRCGAGRSARSRARCGPSCPAGSPLPLTRFHVAPPSVDL